MVVGGPLGVKCGGALQNLLLPAAVFDSVSVSAAVVQVDGSPVRLQLCDTAGQVSLPSRRNTCADATSAPFGSL